MRFVRAPGSLRTRLRLPRSRRASRISRFSARRTSRFSSSTVWRFARTCVPCSLSLKASLSLTVLPLPQLGLDHKNTEAEEYTEKVDVEPLDEEEQIEEEVRPFLRSISTTN